MFWCFDRMLAEFWTLNGRQVMGARDRRLSRFQNAKPNASKRVCGANPIAGHLAQRRTPGRTPRFAAVIGQICPPEPMAAATVPKVATSRMVQVLGGRNGL
jgi:hypothetical protein